MLRNELFVELSDEQQELVAGGRSRSYGKPKKQKKGPYLMKSTNAHFEGTSKLANISVGSLSYAGRHEAYATNHLDVTKYLDTVKSNANTFDYLSK